MTGNDPVAEVARVRAAALTAVGELAGVDRWTVVGVEASLSVACSDPADGTGAGTPTAEKSGARITPTREYGCDLVGTFRGFGAEVTVGMSASALSSGTEPDPEVPLAVLIAAWLRGAAAPDVQARARLVAADVSADECVALGARLRGELDADPEPHGVLVVADGARTLSTGAPGYFEERAPELQRRIDDALDVGDRAGLRVLDPAECARLGVDGRAAYQVLAGLFAPDAADPTVRTYYRDAPFGVGYHVSVWRPGDDREGRAR